MATKLHALALATISRNQNQNAMLWHVAMACCNCMHAHFQLSSILQVCTKGCPSPTACKPVTTHVKSTGSLITRCYTEKAEQAQQHPGSKTTINPAGDNRKKQCRPNETNQTPTQHILAKDTILLHIATPQTHQINAHTSQGRESRNVGKGGGWGLEAGGRWGVEGVIPWSWEGEGVG